MKLARYIIAILFVFYVNLPVFAEGYSILVIPNCCVENTKDRVVGNINIEELLAKKMIDRLEYTGMAYAPTLQVLKISIMNNPNVKPNIMSFSDNAKTLSGAYGVPKVLLISSRTEYQNPNRQKSFWSKLELPVLIQHESDMRLVTTVTLINAKNDEVIWSDVYYKDINLIGEGINSYNTNGAKLSAINNYYDELIPKIFNNIKDTKETHAIMVTGKNLTEPVKEEKPVAKQKRTISFAKYKEKFLSMFSKKEKKKDVIVTEPKKTKVTPNLKMKEEVETTKSDTITNKLKDMVHLKDTGIEPKTLKSDNEKTEPKPVKQKVSNQKIAQQIMDKRSKEAEKKPEEVKVSKISQMKTDFNNKLKNYKRKRAEARVEKLQKQAEKIIAADKEEKKKLTFSEWLKSKYNGFKTKSAVAKEEKQRQKDENVKYSTMVKPDDENTSEATKALQTKPRNNAKNFTPKYDSSVNDI